MLIYASAHVGIYLFGGEWFRIILAFEHTLIQNISEGESTCNRDRSSFLTLQGIFFYSIIFLIH